MAFGGFAGFSAVPRGYAQGAVDFDRIQDIESQKALGRGMQLLMQGAMPGAQPLPTQPQQLQGIDPRNGPPPSQPAPQGPPQPQMPVVPPNAQYLVGPGQMPMARPVVMQPGGPLPGPGAALNMPTQGPQPPSPGLPPQAGPGGMPPPSGPVPGGGGPAPQFQQQGPMTWQQVAQAIVKANPGAPPDLIARAVTKAMPLMQLDSQQQWRQVNEQLQLLRINQAGQLGQQRIETTQRGQDIASEDRQAAIAERERLAQENAELRRQLEATRQSGATARTGLQQEGAATRTEAQIAARKDITGAQIGSREKIAEGAEAGREMRSARTAGEQAANRESREKIAEGAEAGKQERFYAGLGERQRQYDQTFQQKEKQFDEKLKAANAKVAGGQMSEEDMHVVADAIAHYRQAPYQGVAVRSGAAVKIMSEVNRIAESENRKYDVTNWRAKSDAITRFGTGQQGNTIRAIKVADDHLQTLGDLATKLDRKPFDIPLTNYINNQVWTALGYPAPNNVEVAKQIVASEVIKAVSAIGGGVTERLEAAKKIDPSASLPQINGAITTYRNLLSGQIRGYKNQYESATGGNRDFDERYGFTKETGPSAPQTPAQPKPMPGSPFLPEFLKGSHSEAEPSGISKFLSALNPVSSAQAQERLASEAQDPLKGLELPSAAPRERLDQVLKKEGIEGLKLIAPRLHAYLTQPTPPPDFTPNAAGKMQRFDYNPNEAGAVEDLRDLALMALPTPAGALGAVARAGSAIAGIANPSQTRAAESARGATPAAASLPPAAQPGPAPTAATPQPQSIRPDFTSQDTARLKELQTQITALSAQRAKATRDLGPRGAAIQAQSFDQQMQAAQAEIDRIRTGVQERQQEFDRAGQPTAIRNPEEMLRFREAGLGAALATGALKGVSGSGAKRFAKTLGYGAVEGAMGVTTPTLLDLAAPPGTPAHDLAVKNLRDPEWWNNVIGNEAAGGMGYATAGYAGGQALREGGKLAGRIGSRIVQGLRDVFSGTPKVSPPSAPALPQRAAMPGARTIDLPPRDPATGRFISRETPKPKSQRYGGVE